MDDETPTTSTDAAEVRRKRQNEAARLRMQRKRARESSSSRERRRTADAEAKRRSRESESAVERSLRNQADAEAKRRSRESESAVERSLRNQADAEAKRQSRESESIVERYLRNQADAEAKRRSRASESASVRSVKNHADAEAKRRSRQTETAPKKANRQKVDAVSHKKKRLEIKEPTRNADRFDIDEYRLSDFSIKCIHCGALHFAEERVQGKHDKDSFFDCCAHGKIEFKDGDIWVDDTGAHQQPLFGQYPASFRDLFVGSYPEKSNFFVNIRKVNSSYALASLCANRYEFKSNGPYCFKLSGQVYYKFNTAAEPDDGKVPTNGQLFFVDTEEALEHRKAAMSIKDSKKGSYKTDSCFRIFDMIEKYLRENNGYAKSVHDDEGRRRGTSKKSGGKR